MKKKIYFIRDRETIRLIVTNRGFHWLSAILLGIFTLFCFIFPFIVLWFTEDPIGLGFIITIFIFGGTGFYSLRLFLWNITGKEIFEVSNGHIIHYYDYGIFKDNIKNLGHKKMFFCYTTVNEPRSRAIASRGLPSFNVVTVLTFLVSILFSSLCFPDIKK